MITKFKHQKFYILSISSYFMSIHSHLCWKNTQFYNSKQSGLFFFYSEFKMAISSSLENSLNVFPQSHKDFFYQMKNGDWKHLTKQPIDWAQILQRFNEEYIRTKIIPTIEGIYSGYRSINAKPSPEELLINILPRNEVDAYIFKNC